jgi:ribosomal silencing factor RsfS
VSRRAARNDPRTDDPEFSFLEEEVQPRDRSDSQTHNTETIETPKTPIQEGSPPSQVSSVPWYLKTQSSAPSPALNPAEVPELPLNPPPLLATLLEYVSVTAGLDDLQLLDLRHIDPPPALGPKLIMLIATARSEKHLHVAADRFCRYLRREHGLKANAAGLLGRNELKIKLRRKAKRMRMLANVGGVAPEGNIDDGIRTGWICCTLGKIEAHPEDTHMPGDNVQEFVGFRDIKPGVNVVVQMFTEEKRFETDLETLWGGVLRTHERKAKSADETLQELEQDIEELDREGEDSDGPPISRAVADMPAASNSKPTTTHTLQHRPQSTAGDFFPSASEPGSQRQLRRLHTLGL